MNRGMCRSIYCVLMLIGFCSPTVAVSAIQTIPLTGIPTAVAAIQENNQVYISFDNEIGVFDPANLVRVSDIKLGSDTVAFNFDTVWNTLFAPSSTSGVVSLVDVGSATVPVLIPLESTPGVVAINSTTQRLYVALPSENKLKVVDLSKIPFAFESDVNLPSAPTALLVVNGC